MLAADEVPVLMHDPTLERTGLIGGAVSELTAAQLERIDVGGWHSRALRRRDGADAGANAALLPRP